VMTMPLVILALGSIFAGWLGAPDYLWSNLWDPRFEAIFGVHEEHPGLLTTEIYLMLVTLVVVGLGILFAYLWYGRGGKTTEGREESAGGAIYRLLLNKYYVDELYDFLFVRPFTAVSRFLARVFDPWVIDGAVNGIAATARGLSSVWRGIQSGNVQHYLVGFLAGTVALLAYYFSQQ